MTTNSASAADELIRFEAEGLVISYGYTPEDGYSVTVVDLNGGATDFVETALSGDEDFALVTLVSKERDTQLIVVVSDTRASSASLTTPVPAAPPEPIVKSLFVEVVKTVEARVDYDAETGELTLTDAASCCDLDGEDVVLGRWGRDVVDSGALVRRLPLGQVVVEVDGTDSAVEPAIRDLLKKGALVREDEPWGVYGGQRFRAVRVVTD